MTSDPDPAPAVQRPTPWPQGVGQTTSPVLQRLRTGGLPRFVAVGTAGTVLQLVLFVTMASSVNAVTAGAVSWIVSTVVTNVAQSRFTFRTRSTRGAAAAQIVAFLSCLAALTLATGVAVLLCQQPTPARLAALAAVNAVTGVGRFAVLRWWQQRREFPKGRP